MLFYKFLLVATVVAEAATFAVYFQSASQLQPTLSSNWQPSNTARYHTLSRKVILSHPRPRNYVQTAVRTRHRIRYIDTPNEMGREIDPRTPSTIAIGSRSIPVVLYFKTSSSRMSVQHMPDQDNPSEVTPVQPQLSFRPKSKKKSRKVEITAAVQSVVPTTKKPRSVSLEVTTAKPLSDRAKPKEIPKSPTAIPPRTPISMVSDLDSDEDFDKFNMMIDAIIASESDKNFEPIDSFEKGFEELDRQTNTNRNQTSSN